MKKVCWFAVVLPLIMSVSAWSQDAATEERLNKLNGQIEDLVERGKALQQQLSQISREVSALREQAASQPREEYATAADLKHLADRVREVDKKRSDDNELIKGEIAKLGKLLASTPPPKSHPASPPEEDAKQQASRPEAGFEYVVQQGDSLSAIVQACREKGVKVTMDQIRKANPKLVPEKMRVGQKIFIPAP